MDVFILIQTSYHNSAKNGNIRFWNYLINQQAHINAKEE